LALQWLLLEVLPEQRLALRALVVLVLVSPQQLLAGLFLLGLVLGLVQAGWGYRLLLCLLPRLLVVGLVLRLRLLLGWEAGLVS
jgi:hypothetical protein